MLAGPVRSGVWAVRPSSQLFPSESALSGSVEQMLIAHGPLTVDQFASLTDLSGVDSGILEVFLLHHSRNYTRGIDGSYWFARQKRPTARNFDSMSQALIWAFMEFPNGATIEEIHRLLCLSTVAESKRISR